VPQQSKKQSAVFGHADETSLHILTGTFGSGKTAILDSIGEGIRCVAEPAREVIAEQRSINGADYDPAPPVFVASILERSIRNHERARGWGGPVLFDRGVPDGIAYATHQGIDPLPATLASERYRYNIEVLLLEPWDEIYTTDELRTASFGTAVAFHEALVDAYERTGYTLVPVPRGSVEDRVAFVRDHISH
jgi:predicted ATPase